MEADPISLSLTEPYSDEEEEEGFWNISSHSLLASASKRRRNLQVSMKSSTPSYRNVDTMSMTGMSFDSPDFNSSGSPMNRSISKRSMRSKKSRTSLPSSPMNGGMSQRSKGSTSSTQQDPNSNTTTELQAKIKDYVVRAEELRLEVAEYKGHIRQVRRLVEALYQQHGTYETTVHCVQGD